MAYRGVPGICSVLTLGRLVYAADLVRACPTAFLCTVMRGQLPRSSASLHRCLLVAETSCHVVHAPSPSLLPEKGDCWHGRFSFECLSVTDFLGFKKSKFKKSRLPTFDDYTHRFDYYYQLRKTRGKLERRRLGICGFLGITLLPCGRLRRRTFK